MHKKVRKISINRKILLTSGVLLLLFTLILGMNFYSTMKKIWWKWG